MQHHQQYPASIDVFVRRTNLAMWQLANGFVSKLMSVITIGVDRSVRSPLRETRCQNPPASTHKAY